MKPSQTCPQFTLGALVGTLLRAPDGWNSWRSILISGKYLVIENRLLENSAGLTPHA